MKVGEIIVSEGHRFEVATETSGNFTAIEEGSGRVRLGRVLSEHGSGTEVEWLDGDPNWHNNAPPRVVTPYVPPPPPDPAELTRPDRFNRDPFEDS